MASNVDPNDPAVDRGSDTDRVARYAANLQMEREGVALYRALARAEKHPERAAQFEDMATMEEMHARVWEKKLAEIGASVPPAGRMLRPQMVGMMARLFGTRAMAPMVGATERVAARDYEVQGDAPAEMIADEQSHARVFRELARTQEPGEVARQERWHRGTAGGSLRAGIFGINDGLVSNFSLIMGFAGAAQAEQTILLAGIAGLLAGASSMAAGEYISMVSQREIFERQIALEKEEIELAPEAEQLELAMLYQAKGINEEQATTIAATVMSNPDVALRTMALEELGMDPDELGSPIGAAVSSFIMFTIGAFIPLVPYLFIGMLGEGWALVLSAVLAGLALCTVGSLMGVLSGKNLLFSGGRMLVIGAAAAAITYGVGRILGITVAG